MENRRFTDKSLKLFFFITVVLSGAAEAAIIKGGPEWLYLVLMWMPAVAAFSANNVSVRDQGIKLSFKEKLKRLGFKGCSIKYLLLGMVIPFIYLTIPYMIYWRLNPGSCHAKPESITGMCVSILIAAIIGNALSLLSALGEEIGWRGFMVPALLERWGLKKTMVITSLIWCAWHLPILTMGGYMEGTPIWYQVPAFVLCILPVGIICAILTIRTGSLWPAALIHAAHNNYDQAIWGPLTLGDNKMYYVSETGVLTIIFAWLCAIALYFIEKENIKKA